MLKAQLFFESLIGLWKIEREVFINDMIILKGEGAAAFQSINKHILEYNENLTIQNLESNITIQSYQSYQYSINEEENIITKSFKDNSLFYNLALINKYHAVGQHQCKDDLYQSEYIIKEDVLTLIYKVVGINKNYIITSCFKKQNV